MSMLDESIFEGLACAETHGLGSENVQNRNMSLVIKVSASRDPLRNVSSSTISQICPRLRPLYFHLPEPTSAFNLNHVGFDHFCLHSSNVVLWGDIFGDAPVRPEDVFKTPARRPRPKRAKPPDFVAPSFPPPTQLPTTAAPPPPLPGMRPGTPFTHVSNFPQRPPAFGRSVPLRAPAPASQFVIPSHSSWQPAASHSVFHQAPTITPAFVVANEGSIHASAQPPTQQRVQRNQNKPSFISFADDNIQSIKQRDHRVGSSNVASAANAGVERSPPVEGVPRADEQQDFTAFSSPPSDGGFVFPGQCSISGSSSSSTGSE